MSEELIEELARTMADALCAGSPWDDDKPADYHAEGMVAARAILPIIRRRELEAGEKVRDAAATVKPSNTPASECETTGQWTRRTLREAIRALDVATILGESHD